VVTARIKDDGLIGDEIEFASGGVMAGAVDVVPVAEAGSDVVPLMQVMCAEVQLFRLHRRHFRYRAYQPCVPFQREIGARRPADRRKAGVRAVPGVPAEVHDRLTPAHIGSGGVSHLLLAEPEHLLPSGRGRAK
jgi:hypothetical protein